MQNPDSGGSIDYPVLEEKEAPETKIRFRVKRIEVEGISALKEKQWRPLVTPYENQEQTLAAMKGLARQLTGLYQVGGYVTSYATIPPQKVQDGIFKIRVVEGRAGRVEFSGNRFFRKGRMAAYVRVKPGALLNARDLEQSVRGLQANPDRQVRVALKQTKDTPQTDVLFKVKDRFPLHAGFSMDNQGTETIGCQRFGFQLKDQNLTSMDDRVQVGTYFGRHFGMVSSSYFFPVPQTRTELYFAHSHVQTDPQGTLAPYQVNSTADSYMPGLVQTLFENRRMKLTLDGAFDIRDSRTLKESSTYRAERLRIFRLMPVWNVSDRWGWNSWINAFSFAADFLGAKTFADASDPRQNVKPQFFRWRGLWNRYQPLPWWQSRILSRFEYQIASRKLPWQQAMDLGGANMVRGYPEADYLGDAGIFYSLEYLMPTWIFPEDLWLPRAAEPLRRQIETVLFYDHGYGHVRGATLQDFAYRNLIGLGAGLRIHLYKNFYARTECALAAGDHPILEKQNFRFHFRLQAEV